MKKQFLLLLALCIVPLLSFTSSEKDKWSFKVDAPVKVPFDLYMNGEVKHTLKTPYTFTISGGEVNIIIKSLDETSLTVSATGHDSAVVNAQWKTLVFTKRDTELAVFGFD